MIGRTVRIGLAALILSGATVAWAQDAAPAAGAAPVAAAATAPDAAPLYQRMAPTPGIGQPDGGWDLQTPVTPIGKEAASLAQHVLDPLMVAISLFVLGLLAWVVIRYRAAANPTPSTTTHNFTIEVIWTLLPALILVFIAVPSFRLLANQYDPPKADVTIKATGHQWYWSYEYPDYGDISFDALPKEAKELGPNDGPLHLEVDNRVVVPAGATVKMLITAADVLHSWAMPAFWVKMDAIPGRITETWFKVDRPGVYYGQCSELCGTKHGFMPIAVEVLPREKFLDWVRMKQKEGGITPVGPGIAAPVSAAAAPAAAAPAAPAAETPAAAAEPAPAA
ncbi:cytochrome c oxidase subunit II [Sandaracinobacteroides saxicola]|uniref:Cytochrome c oxidase subunit 2 n=1 Tax=Sandaracinobacteroides saxicola TaxID=2759707 RepID=A0A7G5IGZ8_9SPHN|nr:cytochrome c oxidase subunit II [Sandaracinobacteroides saxicola]QMW22640.1 cytochrome c oxidase subunit II [Sandaracinobacteroides saxicola]